MMRRNLGRKKAWTVLVLTFAGLVLTGAWAFSAWASDLDADVPVQSVTWCPKACGNINCHGNPCGCKGVDCVLTSAAN